MFFRKDKLRWEDPTSIQAIPSHGLGSWAGFKGEGKMSSDVHLSFPTLSATCGAPRPQAPAEASVRDGRHM